MTIVGKKAPEWWAPAYVNGDQKMLSSRDFSGRWYLLYWYPRDFTFICPTEIRGFQELLGEFQEEGISVIGCSTDSFHTHKAWFADKRTFAQDVSHPILADSSHTVSRAWHVLDEEAGSALRATALVDDKGIVRSLSVNDPNVGRSPREMLRTAQAYRSGGLCGADWKKGEKFVA